MDGVTDRNTHTHTHKHKGLVCRLKSAGGRPCSLVEESSADSAELQCLPVGLRESDEGGREGKGTSIQGPLLFYTFWDDAKRNGRLKRRIC